VVDRANRPVPEARSLPISQWPELDQQLWVKGLLPVGLLDEPRPAMRWRPATWKSVASSYGRWLYWLFIDDALDPLAPPAQRVTRERLTSYVTDLLMNNASTTVHLRVLHLGLVLEAMTPGSRPVWFAQVLRQLRVAQRPVRDDRPRLVPVRTVLTLGWHLIDRAEQRTAWSPCRRALCYRAGLLMLFLCACSPRVRSLAVCKIGHHLERRGDSWWVTLDAADTKNGRPMDLPLPAAFTPAIGRYLAHWRPILLSRQAIYGATVPTDSGHFWLSETGGALTTKDFNYIVNTVTRRELGRALNPHIFRKIVATELAIHDPAHVQIAQSLLGHASYETTDRAYNLARALDAARSAHGTLTALRREASDLGRSESSHSTPSRSRKRS